MVFAEDIEAYNFVIVYAFALIIGIFKTVNYRMQRGTYFLNTALIILAGSVAQLIWFLVAPAIANGLLIILVIIDITVWILSAYALIVVTKARSNDVYGNARYAALGFIPIANFWLLFTPSKDNFTVKLPSFLTGGTAVFLGLMISVGGRGLGIGIQNSIEDYLVNNTNYETAIKISDRWMSYYISRGDIEEAILFLKSSEDIGSKIDEITILKEINVESDIMEYRFKITDNSVTGFTQQQRTIWEDYICNNYTNLFDGGAMIIWHYYSAKEPMLARIIGDREVCAM